MYDKVNKRKKKNNKTKWKWRNQKKEEECKITHRKMRRKIPKVSH